MKWILGAVGLALLGAGAVKAVTSDGQSGIVIMVIAGAVLIVSPFVVDRLESVSAGTASVEVRFTRQVTDLGAPKAAKALQGTAVAGLVESYAFIHTELPDGRFQDAKSYLQDRLVERAAVVAQTEKLQAREVRTLLAEGPAVIRVLAIGLMLGDASLADGPSIASAIGDFRSRNEQYHALRLAQRCWPRLSRQDRQTIRDTVHTAIDNGSIPADSDRRQLADDVLALPVG
jgi:hypothetical protein